MTSVNETFHNANPPKRKFEDPTTSFGTSTSNKSAKLRNGSTPHSLGAQLSLNGSRSAFVHDEVEEEEEDTEAGPAVPDDQVDNGEDTGEDEEGRFFGGGVSKKERDVMDFIEQNESGETEEAIDITWLKRTMLNFERKISRNAELRAKYEDDPMKFVSSEADLDAEIKNFSLLSEHTELYPDLARSGCAASLVSLLAHENTDIAISVCEVVAELTDEDSGAEENQWNALVDELFKADIAELLVSNLSRFDESNDNDRSGIYHILNILENLLSNKTNANKLGKNKKLLSWLVSRIKKVDKEARGQVGQNRQYTAEILAILLQSSEASVSELAKMGAVDTILQQISIWRKRDPEKDSDEEEFAENLFDCLISTVRNATAVDSFLEGEGVELCVIMLKEGGFSKSSALRLLDHAAGGPGMLTISERIVEAGGLKPLFTTFLKSKKTEREVTEHLLGLYASMLKILPVDSPPRIRLLAKFVEKDYEKITRLVQLRLEYRSRLKAVEISFQKEKKARKNLTEEELEDELVSRRMDAGLFSLQTMDVILAWLTAEDDGARAKIISALQKDGGLGVVKESLIEQLVGMDEDVSEPSRQTREMLEALIQCL